MGKTQVDYEIAKREYEREHDNLTLFEKALWWVALKAPTLRMIYVEGEPYLLRAYLLRGNERVVGRKFIPSLYLHRFMRSDKERDLHNHPWGKAFSLILTKGYTEHRWSTGLKKVVSRFVGPFTVNSIGRDDFHRVSLSNGRCWTLFLSLERENPSDGTDWGFLNPETGEYTQWGRYIEMEETRIRALHIRYSN